MLCSNCVDLIEAGKKLLKINYFDHLFKIAYSKLFGF
jgi:hypothetical protein